MSPIETYTLLFVDTIMGVLVVPVHTSYAFLTLLEYSQSTPWAAIAVTSFAVTLATFGNWWFGRLFTSLIKVPEHYEEKITSSKTAARLKIIRTLFIRFGGVLLLLAAAAPWFGQAVAILAGWLGMRKRHIFVPALLGAFAYYTLLAI